MFKAKGWLIAAAILISPVTAAQAESDKLAVATQHGLGYMQLTLMQDRKLIEKHAAAAGLGNVTVTWSTFRSSDVMIDALLSGNIQVASLGVTGLATIWSKTKGTSQEVKGLAGMNYTPWILNTSDPNIKSIKDYTPQHKIAVPAVQVSTQAMLLQMAAAKEWGNEHYRRLDPLTVSMSHPDGMQALLSKASGITSHFTAPPFAQRELKAPGIRKLLSSTDIVGDDLSLIILGMPTSFYKENPKLTKAFMDAYLEANKMINDDKKMAANEYVRLSGDKTPSEEILEMMEKDMTYTAVPKGTLSFMQFMATVGRLNVRPTDWKEYMHPIAHGMPGS
jgi:NitT/TauT family transport system substrate-binding protein